MSKIKMKLSQFQLCKVRSGLDQGKLELGWVGLNS